MAEVIKQFVPQLFTSPEVMDPKGETPARNDEWKLTKMPADCLLPLTGLHLIATQEGITRKVMKTVTVQKDGVDEVAEVETEEPGPGAYLEDFVQTLLRGFKGIDGYASEQAESIAVALGGKGGGGKMVKKRGFVSRNITHRGEPDYEEVGDEEE